MQRDIASLLDYIQSDMKELDSSRIAVMGGSCELESLPCSVDS
jgi:hypothetical protein